MSLLATIVSASEGAAEVAHELNPLWFPAPLFGVILFVIFCALAIVTFSFRDVANRHAEKAAAYAREHGGQSPNEH